MLEKPDTKPERIPEYRKTNNSVGNQKMTIAIEMQQGVRRLAGPRKSTDSHESMIARAARAAGISYRQAKTFFYAESENPRSQAVQAVRAALSEQEREASDELKELRLRIARLERLMDKAAENRRRAGRHLDGDVDNAGL